MPRVDHRPRRDVAIVTGAAGGIGNAIVTRLLMRGISVTAVDLAFDESALQPHPRLRSVAVDLTDVNTVMSIPSIAEADWGVPATGLVNNAAVSHSQPYLDITRRTWDSTLAVNLTAPMFLSQQFARLLQERGQRGRIVNVTSVNAVAAETNAAAYVASKAGLDGLTRAMAVDLAPLGVTANAVAPGAIETVRAAARHRGRDFSNALRNHVPAKRYGTAEEVAEVISFLLRDAPEYLTGSTLTIDGGLLASIAWES